MESAQNIWNDKPKNKTIYFSDLSRKKAMTHKNGTFELTPINKVLITVNQQLFKYFKHNLEQLEKSGNAKLKKRFEDEISKYYKMYFRSYDNLTDRFQPTDARLEEFERVVNAGLTEFFYNIRDDVKDNYNKIVQDTKNDNILKKLNYQPPKKPKGRPRKILTNILEDPTKILPKVEEIKQIEKVEKPSNNKQNKQTNQTKATIQNTIIDEISNKFKEKGYTDEEIRIAHEKLLKKQLIKSFPKRKTSCKVMIED